ncbi:MAG: hypothetical protein ACJ72E_00480 [Marmoricola sp.]
MRLPGPTTRDPLLPLERLVRALLAVIVSLVLCFLPLAAFGVGGFSFGSIGDTREACVTTDADTFPIVGIGERETRVEREAHQLMGLRPGTELRPDTYEVCNEHPRTRDRITATLALMMPMIFLLGVLLLIYLLIRAAAAHGLFSHATAARTWALGWYLVAGSLVAELLRQAMIGATLSGVTQHAVGDVGRLTWHSTLTRLDFPYAAVIAGVGLITLGRVFARAVVLQQHEDATI